MKDQMYSVHFELAGNDLIAMLHESSEIKRFMPPFNKAQRRKKYRYGLFIREDDKGIRRLQISTLKLDEKPIITCTTRRAAEFTKERVSKKYQLNNAPFPECKRIAIIIR